jgi:hypothetical protein
MRGIDCNAWKNSTWLWFRQFSLQYLFSHYRRQNSYWPWSRKGFIEMKIAWIRARKFFILRKCAQSIPRIKLPPENFKPEILYIIFMGISVNFKMYGNFFFAPCTIYYYLVCLICDKMFIYALNYCPIKDLNKKISYRHFKNLTFLSFGTNVRTNWNSYRSHHFSHFSPNWMTFIGI